MEGLGPSLTRIAHCTLSITRSALSRRNSVGAHYRSDHPGKGRDWRKRTVMEK